MSEKITTLGRLENTPEEKERRKDLNEFMVGTSFAGREISREYRDLAIQREFLSSGQDSCDVLIAEGLTDRQKDILNDIHGILEDAKKFLAGLMKNLPTSAKDSEEMEKALERIKKEREAAEKTAA